MFNVNNSQTPYCNPTSSNSNVPMSDSKTLSYLPEIYFTYLGQGYYSMRSSINGTTYYLTSPASTSSGKKITWSTTFSATNNNQLWQVSYLSNEKAYTIKSKNMILAGKDYSLSVASGYLVQKTTNSTNAQWKLCYDEVYHGDNLLIGIIDSQHSDNHSSWIGHAASALYDFGSDSNIIYYNADFPSDNELEEDTQKELLMECMEESKIKKYYAHGISDNSGSYIRLSDTVVTTVYLTTDDIKQLDLSDTELILFGSCSTAANYNVSQAENLLTASVNNANALMAVGFTQQILCSSLLIFMQTITYNYNAQLASYTDYSSRTTAEQLAIRSNCYLMAIEQAADASRLSHSCVIFTNGNYITLS